MKRIFITTLMITAIGLTSCSPRLRGTWNVQRYESIQQGEPNVILENIGTMTFNRKGKGEKQLDYSVMGMRRDDRLPFRWELRDGKYISIDDGISELSKTWIIMEDKRKSQLWKSTDGSNRVQVLELKKR